MSIEILTVVDSVSLEKGVSKEVILDALELALASATKKKYAEDAEFRVAIDRQTGEYETYRTWRVIDPEELEEEQNPDAEWTVEQAHETDPNLNLGDTYEVHVDSVEFGRIAAQTAKQVIVQKVREAERAQVIEAYLPRVGELVSGTVKKVTREAVICDLGNNAEALLSRENLIPRETFRVGDRLRALPKRHLAEPPTYMWRAIRSSMTPEILLSVASINPSRPSSSSLFSNCRTGT